VADIDDDISLDAAEDDEEEDDEDEDDIAERVFVLGLALATLLLDDDDTVDAALVCAWVRAGTAAVPATSTTTAAIGRQARMGLPSLDEFRTDDHPRRQYSTKPA
jgi:hypothetical protein